MPKSPQTAKFSTISFRALHCSFEEAYRLMEGTGCIYGHLKWQELNSLTDRMAWELAGRQLTMRKKELIKPPSTSGLLPSGALIESSERLLVPWTRSSGVDWQMQPWAPDASLRVLKNLQ